MKIIDLNGTWRLVGGGYDIKAAVPGSVASALLAQNMMPDPYYGANEELVQPIFDHDYTFSRTFTLTEEDSKQDRIYLRCDGLDTLCQITVNDTEIASTDNMHCQYRFDISKALRAGENSISLLFRSPAERMKTLTSPLGKGFASMRKAHCMFGWDWGIRLPDSGIWRDICIELMDGGRVGDVSVRQRHEQNSICLDLEVCTELCTDEAQLQITITDPDGTLVYENTVTAAENICHTVGISQPQLWWPVGYGKQPLYCVEVKLIRGGEALDTKRLSIGLRTVSLYRGKSNRGDYQFRVNGIPIYIKGANIIIDDAIISRTTNTSWEQMIRNAVLANYNTLRVWGGAYYPPDIFFELCDRFGILVYQDFMFACKFYWPSKEFLSSIREEVTQTVLRLRNHPSLCLWCGNNEADFFYTAFVSRERETEAIRIMFNKERLNGIYRVLVRWLYSKTFLKVIPSIVRKLSPDVDFVHSSPSVGDRLGAESLFDYFANGDAHYYHHVNADAPYQKLEQYHLRFLSEFGFQSYPSLKTLREYLPAESLSPYSKEMLVHQKSPQGNETIELYLSRDFFVPAEFEHYVYMSQMMAGEILRYTAEHMRRDRDYSRGLLLWQHNDCWPVVSWAGVDYRGRWKGQQYYAKRFFAPVLVSAKENGAQIGLHVVNDHPCPVEGQLAWTLYNGREAVTAGVKDITLPASGAAVYAEVDTPENSVRNGCVLCYAFQQGENVLSRGSMLLVEQNEFAFELPSIRVDIQKRDGEYRLELVSDCYVKALCLDLVQSDAIFSDNFFDLEPGVPYTVTVHEKDLQGMFDSDAIKDQLTFTCVNQIACEMKG